MQRAADPPKAAVVPVPVCARAGRSLPLRTTGIECDWTGVGRVEPASMSESPVVVNGTGECS
ncbi:MAG: hypothetical protein ACRD26_01240 [Vicinamibacterales bacterium]